MQLDVRLRFIIYYTCIVLGISDNGEIEASFHRDWSLLLSERGIEAQNASSLGSIYCLSPIDAAMDEFDAHSPYRIVYLVFVPFVTPTPKPLFPVFLFGHIAQ